MPIDDPHVAHGRRRIVRMLRCVRGHFEFRVRVAPRFDFARRAHTTSVDGHRARFDAGEVVLGLSSSEVLERDGDDATAHVALSEGDQAGFVLDATAGKAAAQVFAGGVLARPCLGQLGFGLGQRALGLHGFEAGGVTELLAALDGHGLPFEQDELLVPLRCGSVFLQPDEPVFEQGAARFVQRIALPG